MNHKGQSQIGLLIGLAIVLIVGVILLQASAQQVGSVTNTITAANITFTGVANGTESNIPGRSWSDLVVYNVTNDFLIASGNYTLANNQVVDGVLTATLTPDASTPVAGHDWLLSGVFQPETYIDDSGGRALSNIIILLFALALAVVAMIPTIKQKFDL